MPESSLLTDWFPAGAPGLGVRDGGAGKRDVLANLEKRGFGGWGICLRGKWLGFRVFGGKPGALQVFLEICNKESVLIRLYI